MNKVILGYTSDFYGYWTGSEWSPDRGQAQLFGEDDETPDDFEPWIVVGDKRHYIQRLDVWDPVLPPEQVQVAYRLAEGYGHGWAAELQLPDILSDRLITPLTIEARYRAERAKDGYDPDGIGGPRIIPGGDDICHRTATQRLNWHIHPDGSGYCWIQRPQGVVLEVSWTPQLTVSIKHLGDDFAARHMDAAVTFAFLLLHGQYGASNPGGDYLAARLEVAELLARQLGLPAPSLDIYGDIVYGTPDTRTVEGPDLGGDDVARTLTSAELAAFRAAQGGEK